MVNDLHTPDEPGITDEGVGMQNELEGICQQCVQMDQPGTYKHSLTVSLHADSLSEKYSHMSLR